MDALITHFEAGKVKINLLFFFKLLITCGNSPCKYIYLLIEPHYPMDRGQEFQAMATQLLKKMLDVLI